ncbi:MAG: CocE/NonD family hydrolase [Acidobacteria bacterium]|nr:CocE/NonD family hydrolase [Acidobacteriota bacterium]
MRPLRLHLLLALITLALASLTLHGSQAPAARPAPVRDRYSKAEHLVPMRDGTRLHTAVYSPRTCVSGGYPILLQRTPYSVASYGRDRYPASIGPSPALQADGYVIVYQDVRGRYLSEGVWEEVRPLVAAAHGAVDESTDAYDTIDWLVKQTPCNNGRVGMWGISYPGFYALAALVNAHPALKAVSPQGPVTDYYLGDDSYHNGAFMLAHNFSFYVDFFPRGAQPRTPQKERRFDYGTPDGYAFYLAMGPLARASRRYGLDRNPYWMMNLEHTTYDAFWQARSIWRHLRGVTPAVLTVGGWFDAENLRGALRTHATIAAQSPQTVNQLVMGPWTHGSWSSPDGSRVGQLRFGQQTAAYFRDQLERPFFARWLKGPPTAILPAASIFETGSNRWRSFETWPPGSTPQVFYLGAGGTLRPTASAAGEDAFDAYVSDPANPVPIVDRMAIGMPRDYMASDQRFAAARRDVLVYRSEVLADDLTVLGSIGVTLHVATSGTDADFVTKIVDEYPAASGGPTAASGGPQDSSAAADPSMAGYQLLVRGEPFRGKFRNSFERPEPFAPNVPATIHFELPDVAHTFRRGHRLVVQVQSSWFPLFDRNPQQFMDVPTASPADFVPATQRIYRSAARPSSITVPVER